MEIGGGPPPEAAPPGWRARLGTLVRAFHRILGAPDYDAYLAHHGRCHPGTPPLPYAEFARRRYEERATRTGSRCC